MPEATSIREGQLIFQFPDNWTVTKFDEWSFYRNQFQRVCNGTKAVDLIAVSPDRWVWLIEVKDYRQKRRAKDIPLKDEIAYKVRDTLAALLPAYVNANEESEKQIAGEVLAATRIRVVLHLEQPEQQSKLFPRAIDPAKLKQQLKQLLKAIDPHPQILTMSDLHKVTWKVTNAP